MVCSAPVPAINSGISGEAEYWAKGVCGGGGVLFLTDSHSVHAWSEKLRHCKLTLLLITSSINLVLFCITKKTCSGTAVSSV